MITTIVITRLIWVWEESDANEKTKPNQLCVTGSSKMLRAELCVLNCLGAKTELAAAHSGSYMIWLFPRTAGNP